MNELALFAGAGGGILGGKLLGWRTVCAVEWDAYAATVLCARQNDGVLPPFPIWDDVRTFDGRPWRGRVDVVSGGFPCQDISAAGKGAGIDGERSGMWREMARIVGEVGPRYVFVENSPMLTSRGLGRVLGDLASLGYDARWGVLGAFNAGAPHRRDRIWIVADANSYRLREQSKPELGRGATPIITADGAEESLAYANGSWSGRRTGFCETGSIENGAVTTDGGSVLHTAIERHDDGRRIERQESGPRPWRPDYWKFEPDVGRVADGVAARVDRLRCLGNGQVPAVAALAWTILTQS